MATRMLVLCTVVLCGTSTVSTSPISPYQNTSIFNARQEHDSTDTTPHDIQHSSALKAGCYSNHDCRNSSRGEYCVVDLNPGPGPSQYGPPPPSGCTTYSLLEPRNEGLCQESCGVTDPNSPVCDSRLCAFYSDERLAAPHVIGDLVYLAENCVSGATINTDKGPCSIC